MKKKYQWLILMSAVLMLIVANAINFGSEKEMSWSHRLLYLLALSIGITIHFSPILMVAHWMQDRMPGLAATGRRIFMSFATALPVTTVLMTITDLWIQHYSSNEVYAFNLKVLTLNLTQSAVACIYTIGLAEAFYHYGLLSRSEKEKAELLRINLYSQYDSLKQQVSPHFLFNSLNSLSSLISLDPPKAEMFVEEMSHVYRYLLQSNREELVPLQRELSFIQSYFHMLKTRFGEALQVYLTVEEEYYQSKIPPLTLQLLVENAVKHNEISTEKPLHIHISTNETGRLLVKNNLQKKLVALPSEKVGLANIMAKYRLLGYSEVEVEENPNEFVVSLPLIK